MQCPKCSSSELSKNGHRGGRQCYLCRICGYQFTSMVYRERPLWEKILASLFYAVGVSPRDIARLFNTSTSSVQRWRVVGNARANEREPRRQAPAVVSVDRLLPHLDQAAGGTAGGQKPLVLIVDEKKSKVVGFIMLQED